MIHYTLQDEPKKELYMYIVHLNQGNEITVKDIIKSFPVPGRFFLRFRTLIQDEKPPVTVWLDLPEEDAPVPFYKGTIYVKALQIPPFENRNLLKPIRKMYKTGVTQHQHNHRNHNTHVKAHEPIGKKPMNDFMDFGSDEVASKPFDLRSHSQDPPRPTMDVSQSHSATTLEDPTNGLSTEELKIRKEKFIQDQIKAKTETAKKT